jgi:hemoglobin
MTTLFDQLGGKAVIDLAVDNFYDRVLADKRIQHFFSNVDMAKQREHQKAFLTYAFGGNSQYDGRSMRKAHEHLVREMGLSDEHFDAVIENLAATLKELGVSEKLIAQVAAVAASAEQKREVLNQ